MSLLVRVRTDPDKGKESQTYHVIKMVIPLPVLLVFEVATSTERKDSPSTFQVTSRHNSHFNH